MAIFPICTIRLRTMVLIFVAFLLANLDQELYPRVVAYSCGLGCLPPVMPCPPPLPKPICLPPPPCPMPLPMPCPICPPPCPPCLPQICPPPTICPPPLPPPMCPPPLPQLPQMPQMPCLCNPSMGSSYLSGPPPIPAGSGMQTYGGIPPINDCCCRCAVPCQFMGRAKTHGAKIFTVPNEEFNDDATCNSEKLRRIIEENITEDPTTSKRAIQAAAEKKLFSKFNVICAKSEFSYVAYTDTYCQATVGEVTCYSFRPEEGFKSGSNPSSTLTNEHKNNNDEDSLTTQATEAK